MSGSCIHIETFKSQDPNCLGLWQHRSKKLENINMLGSVEAVNTKQSTSATCILLPMYCAGNWRTNKRALHLMIFQECLMAFVKSISEFWFCHQVFAMSMKRVGLRILTRTAYRQTGYKMSKLWLSVTTQEESQLKLYFQQSSCRNKSSKRWSKNTVELTWQVYLVTKI